MKDLLGATDVLPWGEMHRKTNAKAAVVESAGGEHSASPVPPSSNYRTDFAKPEDPVPAGRAHVDQDEAQSRTFMNEFGIPYTLEDGNRGMIINLWRPLKVCLVLKNTASADDNSRDPLRTLHWSARDRR